MKFDSIEQELYLNLWRTYDRLRILEDSLFDQFDISSQQYNVLRLLGAAFPEAIPTLTVAGRLISRAPDITRLLDRLEKKGLLERIRKGDDRRQVHVRITDDGKKLLKKIQKPLEECHHSQLGHLSNQKIKQLCSLLRDARAPHEPEQSPWLEEST